ncbi:hypothetical protein FGADI_7369 [Fusarium gaditjirri]|uniref:Protein kinase domain-containing protein n=1 Tax=Fusarium gaditjirri TaxID=282569 RepID=A0A8H4T5H5_9HYPO|nr:hypothetical protein FGADI_7369 [Fusarium gaditjirri]
MDTYLDPINRKFADAAAQGPPLYTKTYQEARDILEGIQSYKTASDIKTEEVKVAVNGEDVTTVIFRPANAQGTLNMIFYTHGGGWILGSPTAHGALMEDFARQTGAAVVFPYYTPAPEAQYPVQFEQVYGVLDHFVNNGDKYNLKVDRFGLAGDSVGGHMAIAMTQLAQSRNLPSKIGQIVLLYPVTDTHSKSETYKTYKDGPYLSEKTMDWMIPAFLPNEEDRKFPLTSPLQYAPDEVLAKFPPTTVFLSGADPLIGEGEAFGHRLQQLGVDAAVIKADGQVHDFAMLAPVRVSPTARAVVELASSKLLKAFVDKSRVEVLMRTDHSVLYIDKAEPEIVFKAETIWIDSKPYGPPSLVEETNKDLTREHDVYKAISPHPYITECLGIVHDDDGHAIALKLERATKGNLRHIIEETPEPPSVDRRIEMATILVEGVSYLHSRGVIWGDISTRNVLVFSDDTLKICDFASSSLSRTYPEFGPHTYEPAYYPALPEEKVGRLSMMQRELYALGSLIYEITEWKFPYAGIDGDIWEIVEAGTIPVIGIMATSTPGLFKVTNVTLNPAELHVTATTPIIICIFCLPFFELYAQMFKAVEEIQPFQDITQVPLCFLNIDFSKLDEVDSERSIAKPPEPILQLIVVEEVR